MDSYKIQMLLATIQTGSFSKAAEQCNCSQPAITQAMNSLEAELDIKLLNRSHSGVTLTEHGEKMLPLIMQVDMSMKNVMTAADKLRKGTTNVIRIGSFASIANTWLPPLLAEFVKINPEVEIELMIATNDLDKYMLRGETDISFTDNLRNKSFRFYPLDEEPMSFVVNKEAYDGPLDSIQVEDISNYPFIMPILDTQEHLIDIKPKNYIPIFSDSDDIAVNMVAQGLGTTIVPAIAIPANIPETVVTVPTVPELKRTVGMAVPNSPSSITNKLVEFVNKNYKRI